MFFRVAYSILTVFGITNAWTDYLNFDNCDNYQTHSVNPDTFYEISWNGDSISTPRCRIGFHAYDSDHVLNQYKVCIQATYWNIQNTEVQLKYYSGLGNFLEKTYTYYSSWDSPTTQWCSDSDEFVDIELVTANSDYNQGSFTLKVTGVMTYNYDSTMGWIIGGTVGGLFLVTIIITIIVIVACRRRRSPGITYGVVDPQGGYANHGYGTIAAPPPYYSNPKNVVVQNNQGQKTYQQYPSSAASQQTATQQTTTVTQETKTE